MVSQPEESNRGALYYTLIMAQVLCHYKKNGLLMYPVQ
ncbi:unnamed protein product [Spirodela intermedia]|uniref:Uncharacterized protein n=1 Tax=Spirodela intermedia TaxID=51605 RepID=A0A7I8L0E4_SPIIN|nr:unnamed protein product [Spirodela intermedia]